MMLQEIPLGEDERAAVEDGIAAMEELCVRLRCADPCGANTKSASNGVWRDANRDTYRTDRTEKAEKVKGQV